MLSALFALPMRIVRGVLNNPLAAGAFLCAAAGGVAVSDTWIGHFVGGVVNIGPIWLPHVLFAGAVLLIVLDLFRDGIPERFAIYLALFAPSLAMAIPKDAKLHQKMAGWIENLNNWLDRTIGPWLTGDKKDVALTIIGFVGITVAVLWCERYAKNGSADMAADAATTSSSSTVTTTATPTPARRRARAR